MTYGVPGAAAARHVVYDAPEAPDGSSAVVAAAQSGRCVVTITAGAGGGLTGHPLIFDVGAASGGCVVTVAAGEPAGSSSTSGSGGGALDGGADAAAVPSGTGNAAGAGGGGGESSGGSSGTPVVSSPGALEAGAGASNRAAGGTVQGDQASASLDAGGASAGCGCRVVAGLADRGPLKGWAWVLGALVLGAGRLRRRTGYLAFDEGGSSHGQHRPDGPRQQPPASGPPRARHPTTSRSIWS